jgi:hypothetical protein
VTALLLVAVTGAPVLVAPAGANGNGTFSVDPGGAGDEGARSAFVYTLRPGQVFQDTVEVANTTDHVLSLDLYGTDAFNTPVDAAFALRLGTEEPTDVGTWVTLAVDHLNIDPGSRAVVPFQVTIPDDATPGDHVGGIVAEDTEVQPGDDQSGVAIDVRTRVAARLYVRVDGPISAELQVKRLDVAHHSALLPPFTGHGDATVTYEIRNTGNVRLSPTADLEVTGFLGRRVAAFDQRQIPELLPGSSVIVTEQFDGLPPLEHLRAHLEARATVDLAGEEAVAARSTGFWAVSWLVVAILVAIAGGLAWWWRRRRGGRPTATATGAPTRPPTRELVRT